MGKVCKVKSCPSGRNLKNKENDISQPPSFFRPTVCKINLYELLFIKLEIFPFL